LCGGAIQTAERLVAVFRSPLTTGIFDNSAGCGFAADLKRAGFDALLLKGEAAELSRLRIDSSGGCLLSVPEMAGLTTQQVLSNHSDGSSLVVGPAGEHQVRFASVVPSAGEPLSRGGLGALFGRMNLKVLSAVGDRSFPPAAEEACTRAQADIQRLYQASPFLLGPLGIGACGTAALLDLTQARQMLPTDNFCRTTYVDAASFSAAQLKGNTGYSADPCPGCEIACRKRDAGGSLPEYDSLAHFSALLGVRDLKTVIAAERSCQSLGLDPVSTAVVLASYYAGSNRAPDAESITELIEQIAYRRGEGAALADGLKESVARSATNQTSFCSKGLELPAFDPRGAYGLALSLALSPSGEYRHAQAHFHELLRKPVPTERFSFSGKARITLLAEDATAACDSLCICRHTLVAAGLEEYAALLSAQTGVDFDAARLAAVGRQTIMRERWLNQQYGFGADDDSLPSFFFAEGENQGLDRQQFLAERDRYYRLRGLDLNGRLPEPPVEPM
jgi:aldehyde:ferredoxin oxidoreductase